MTVRLLDVNLLIALVDPSHVFNESSHRWFEMVGKHGWATTPITENGFVRILSSGRYPGIGADASTTLDLLREFCRAGAHQFWADDLSLREIVSPGLAFTSVQIADAYLLGIAVQRNAKFATLDSRVPSHLVKGGIDALEVVPF
jgi:uncharacterized protein